ncbi:MAG: TIR domain-containing protein [Burkholderiales bacterium]
MPNNHKELIGLKDLEGRRRIGVADSVIRRSTSGYFVGKLGRSRVCFLYTGDVALPSDVHGMAEHEQEYQNQM